MGENQQVFVYDGVAPEYGCTHTVCTMHQGGAGDTAEMTVQNSCNGCLAGKTDWRGKTVYDRNLYVFYISRLLKRTPEGHAVPSNTLLSTHVQCFSVETCIKTEIKSQKQQHLYYLGNLPEPSKNPKLKTSIMVN